MPNKYPDLTYVAKSRRWRKRYRGKDYYFPQQGGETKKQSYDRCLEEWRRKKGTLDRAEYDQSPDRQAWHDQLEWALEECDTAKAVGMAAAWSQARQTAQFAQLAIETKRSFAVRHRRMLRVNKAVRYWPVGPHPESSPAAPSMW